MKTTKKTLMRLDVFSSSLFTNKNLIIISIIHSFMDWILFLYTCIIVALYCVFFSYALWMIIMDHHYRLLLRRPKKQKNKKKFNSKVI